MAEIQINNTILFNTGYIVTTSITLTQGVAYSLNISDGIYSINRVFTPTNPNSSVIIDSWGLYNPTNTNICFTLTDTPPICTQLTCNLQVS